MGYILSILQALSLIRIALLITTILILAKGLLGFEIPTIRMWLYTTLIFTFVHMITESFRNKYIKNTKIISSLFLTFFWIIFINFSNLYLFIINDAEGLQTLTCAITLGVLAIYLYQNLKRSFDVFASIKISSRLLITLSFLLVIAIGTVLLILPLSIQPGSAKLSLINAFFTAVSAVCVTGLTVVDTSTYFSRFGQTIIIILVQIGSLGLVTITTAFISLLGKKISLTGHMSAQDSISHINKENSLGKYLIFSVSFTIIVELIIGVLLFNEFIKFLKFPDALFYTIFHSISAFCNAGFSLFSNSLIEFRTNIIINIAVMSAIIIGGLGFNTWLDLKSKFIERERKNISLQTLIALRISMYLIIIGTIGFFILEKDGVLRDLGISDKLLSSLFASVNLRTSGFQTLDLSRTNDASRLLSLLMMYIGASPGSTGGGIKTTSLMVILASVNASIKNRQDIVIFGKRIEDSLVTQTWTLFFHSFTWIFTITLILCAVDHMSLSDAAFETFSAYGTVGLSTGYTSSLSNISKILIATTMILGRVGPTTVMLALIGKANKPILIRTPAEKLSIG